jgi:SH3-like domain-containing protein
MKRLIRTPMLLGAVGPVTWARLYGWFVMVVGIATACAPLAIAADASSPALLRGSTGLAVPRFVSLKVDRVNLRQGPGTEYPTSWVFHRAGLPVEILKEFEGWRQIRDAEGAVGWVQGVMLSGRRTALVSPWELKSSTATAATARTPAPLRDDDRPDAPAIAFAEPGVVAGVMACDGRWCRVSVGGVRGYIEQVKLWGVYAGEIVK